ncbi:unknown [Clostridium sp. CAG:967]|mgnify:FL=1|nr:unknown [Clostridium sp. CAG:967]
MEEIQESTNNREQTMGVSNVYNSNKIDLVKLALTNKSKSTAASRKPDYMQMTGSIFNAPNAKSTTSTNSLSDLNTLRSLNDINNKNNETESTNGKSSSGSNLDNIANIDNAADGKAAARSAEASSDEIAAQTKSSQADEKTVTKFDSDAQKLDKQMEKDDKKFQQTLKKQENEIKDNNTKLEKLAKETEETQTEIDAAQNELDSLLATSAFTINNAQNSSGTSNSNPNEGRIQELQTLIGSKIELTQANGKQIYSIQRSSSRTITRMNKTNSTFVKTQTKNQKTLNTNQTKAQKAIEVATKFEQAAALVSQVGQTVNLAGKGLVALGASMSWAAGAGAALIAAGNVMQKVGTVTEMVGNYGQAAANITKAAAYAADGNLSGALQSAAGAIQTGAAAVKTTKGLGKTFDSINEQANQATQKLAANSAARETVKDMTTEQLGGMSKKEARKAISQDLQNQMAEGSIATSKKGALGQMKELKNNALEGDSQTLKMNSQTGKIEQNITKSKATIALEKAKSDFASAVAKENATLTDGVITGLDSKGRKAVKAKMASRFSNTATDTVKSSKKFDASKLVQGLQSTAALFNQQGTQQTASTNKGPAPQWDLSRDSRYQKIRNSRLSNA